MPSVSSPTDRMLARLALLIITGGLLYGSLAVLGPLYWRLYSTHIRPFDHTPDWSPASGGAVATVTADPAAPPALQQAQGEKGRCRR